MIGAAEEGYAVPDARRHRGIGRTIGALPLVQIVVGPFMQFGLLGPVFAPPGFLVNAATHAVQVRIAALLGLALSALSLGIAITAFPVFRRYSQALALWLLALAVASFSLTAVESTTVLSLLSLSQAYATASAAHGELLQLLRSVVAASRNWAHYVGLMVAGSMIFVLYGVLYRFALVPRTLAAFGLAAAVLLVAAVTMPVFGRAIVFLLLLPLVLTQLALAGWLLARGFRAGERPVSGVRSDPRLRSRGAEP